MYPDGIPVGNGQTDEKRWMFDVCPGYYLRSPKDYTNAVDVGNMMTPIEMVWPKHWEATTGIKVVDEYGNPPPKLEKGVLLMESEIRARKALEAQAHSEKMKRSKK